MGDLVCKSQVQRIALSSKTFHYIGKETKKKKAAESQATVVCCKSLFNRNSSISSAIAQRNRRQQHAYKTEGKYSRRKMEHFTWRGSKWLELMTP